MVQRVGDAEVKKGRNTAPFAAPRCTQLIKIIVDVNPESYFRNILTSLRQRMGSWLILGRIFDADTSEIAGPTSEF